MYAETKGKIENIIFGIFKRSADRVTGSDEFYIRITSTDGNPPHEVKLEDSQLWEIVRQVNEFKKVFSKT